MREILGSVREEDQFRLWQENATELAAVSRCINEITSSTNVPFMSLSVDFKNKAPREFS